MRLSRCVFSHDFARLAMGALEASHVSILPRSVLPPVNQHRKPGLRPTRIAIGKGHHMPYHETIVSLHVCPVLPKVT